MNKVTPEDHINLLNAADDLSGIKKLPVLRRVCTEIMGSLTPDLIQINNMAIFPIRAPENVTAWAHDQRLNFIMDRLKGVTGYATFKDVATLQGHKMAPYDDLFFNSLEKDDADWVKANYVIAAMPLWMIFTKNEDIQIQYGVQYEEEDFLRMSQISLDNATYKNPTVTNLFSDLSMEKHLETSRSMLAFCEEIARNLQSKLIYFGAISMMMREEREKSPNSNLVVYDSIGYSKVPIEDIGTVVDLGLTLLEKTPKTVSIYSWDYGAKGIRNILTNNLKGKGTTMAHLISNSVSYGAVTNFIKCFNL